jgi:hypothetical protein
MTMLSDRANNEINHQIWARGADKLQAAIHGALVDGDHGLLARLRRLAELRADIAALGRVLPMYQQDTADGFAPVVTLPGHEALMEHMATRREAAAIIEQELEAIIDAADSVRSWADREAHICP